MPSNIIKVKKAYLEKRREQYKKEGSRRRNFAKLKNGLIEKYVNDELDLKDRQLDSILKLVDPKTDETAISQGYFHACTAFGKTYLMIALAESYRHIESNKKIIIFEESAKVLEQVKKDFIEKTNFTEDDIGAYYGKEKTPKAPIIICTYASMGKLLQEVGQENIGLVLCDEAHHILSENRQKVAENFNYACFYGFTATPEYDKDRDCANVFGEVIDSVTLREGVENGLLCSFKNSLMVSRTAIDLTDAKNSTGDYDAQKLAEILKQSHLTGIREEIANFYLYGEDASIGKLNGKTTIINTPNQEEANELAKTFNSIAGKQIAKAYHTNSDESVLDEFNQGIFPVLIQVNRISEGYSNPKAEVCFNYPTASKVRSAQCGGRVLRSNKENPDKLALIIDICFKKTDSPSVLDEIRANGQVLFMDIAEDVAIITPNLQTKLDKENTPHHTRSTTPKDYSITELFDTYTDIKELYDMRFNQMLTDEENTSIREKQDDDLDIATFQKSWSLARNLEVLDQKQKNDLWKKLLENEETKNLFTFVKSNNGPPSYVISKENQEKLKTYLKEHNFDLIEREKQDDDLDIATFQSSWSLAHNLKPLAPKQRNDLWKKLLENKETKNLFTFVKAGGHPTYVISKENQEKLKTYLKEHNFDLIEREKQDDDLDINIFQESWSLAHNLKPLDKKQKNDLWKKLLENEETKNLFTFVKAGANISYVISKENQEKLKTYLKEHNFDLAERKKQNDDLDNHTFQAKWSLAHNLKALDAKQKSDLWKKLLENEETKNLFTFVKSGGHPTYVISKENQKKLKTYLKEHNYNFIEREKQYDDLDIATFQNSWSLAHNLKPLVPKQRSDLWKKLLENKETKNLFTFVKAGNSITYVISKENQEKLKTYLKEHNFDLAERKKQNDDLDNHTFQAKWSLAHNLKALDAKQKSDLWKKLLENEETKNLFTFVKANNGPPSYVISKENQKKLKYLLEQNGITIKISVPKDKTNSKTPPSNDGR